MTPEEKIDLAVKIIAEAWEDESVERTGPETYRAYLVAVSTVLEFGRRPEKKEEKT